MDHERRPEDQPSRRGVSELAAVVAMMERFGWTPETVSNMRIPTLRAVLSGIEELDDHRENAADPARRRINRTDRDWWERERAAFREAVRKDRNR